MNLNKNISEEKEQSKCFYFLGFPIGFPLPLIIGLIWDQIELGIAIGFVLSISIGLYMQNKSKTQIKDPQMKPKKISLIIRIVLLIIIVGFAVWTSLNFIDK